MSVCLSLSLSWLGEKWFDRNKILKYVAIYKEFSSAMVQIIRPACGSLENLH